MYFFQVAGSAPARKNVPPSGGPRPVDSTKALRLNCSGDEDELISVWYLKLGGSLNSKNTYLRYPNSAYLYLHGNIQGHAQRTGVDRSPRAAADQETRRAQVSYLQVHALPDALARHKSRHQGNDELAQRLLAMRRGPQLRRRKAHGPRP